MRSGNRHVILMMMTMVWPCLTLWLISDIISTAAVASPVLLRSAREHAGGGGGGGGAAMSVEMESARTPHRRGDLEKEKEEVEALLRPIRIVAIGDSITSCSGVRPSFDFAYLSYRQALYYRLLLHAAQQTEVRERRATDATTATAGGNHHNNGTDDAAAAERIDDDDDRGDTPSMAEMRRGRRRTRRRRSAAEDGGWVRIGRCRLSFVGPRHGCNRKLKENGFPPPFPSSPPSLLWDRLMENNLTHHSTTTPLPSSSPLLLYAFPDHHDAYFGRRAADLLQELARWGQEKDRPPSTSEKEHRQESVLRQFYYIHSRHDDVPRPHQTPVDVVLLWIGINDLLLDATSGDDAAQRVAAVLEQLQRRFPDALYFVGTPLLIDPKRAKIKRSRREALLNSIHQLQDRLEEMFGGPPTAHDPQQQSRFSRGVQDDEVGRTTTTTLATGVRTALESNDGNNNNKNNNTTSSSKTKKVTLVRFPSFHPSVHTYDGLHPNHEGEWRIAASWFEALQSQLFDRDAFGCRRRRRRASSSPSIRIRSGSAPMNLLAPPSSSSPHFSSYSPGMVPPARFESTDDSPLLDLKQSSREAARSATTMDETKSMAAAADVDPLEALLPQLLFASMLVFVVCGPRVWRCIYRRRVAV